MDNASPVATNLRRAELYEEIWTTLTTKLAPDFGRSEVAIKKTCKSRAIPKIVVRLWGKVAHRKHVARLPLPVLTDNHLAIIEIKTRPLAAVG